MILIDSNIYRAQLLMHLLVEDYDMDEETLRINEALLSEDESPIKLIATLDTDDEIREESDADSAEVEDLLGIDTLIDKLEDFEDDNQEELDLDLKTTPTFRLNLVSDDDEDLKKDDDDHFKQFNVILKKVEHLADPDSNEEIIDLNLDTNNKSGDLQVNIDDTKNKLKLNVVDLWDDNSDFLDDSGDIKVKLKDKKQEDLFDSNGNLKVNIKDNKKINLDLKDNNADFAVNLNDNPIPGDKGTINLTLKDKEPEIQLNLKGNDTNSSKELKLKLSDKDKDGNPKGDIKIKLNDANDRTSSTGDSKVDEFIKKRDELLAEEDPNLKLSTILKIIVQLKKSLERLINHIPNEVILVRTKYIIGDILDNLMDNSELILKDDEKLKKIIFRVFSLVISINDYITKKYTELEDNLDDQTKPTDDKQIEDSIESAEKNQEEKLKNNEIDNHASNMAPKEEELIQNKVEPTYKRPNINKKRI